MKKIKSIRLFLIFIIISTFFACTGIMKNTAPKTSEYFPDGEWRISTPEQQGVDSEALCETLDYIMLKKLPMHSLMIVKNGYVVLDVFFYPYTKGRKHDVASVTKSITTTLTGIALDKGYIKDIHQPVNDFFPEYEDILKNKETITIKDLLTMTSGFDCGYQPGEKELYEMRQSPNWVETALRMNMAAKPGTEFSYCSNGMHLLSAITTRSTGRSALDFAWEYLFTPLGINDVVWPTDPQGINNGGGDIRMHPHDMAKIGYLFLNQGNWNGRQILPGKWVKNAVKKQINVPENVLGYGYGWWTFPEEYQGMYAARGRGGQEIIVWPKYNMVLIVTGGGVDIGELSPFLIKALRSNSALPVNNAAAKKLDQKIQLIAGMPSETATQSPAPTPAFVKQFSGKVYHLPSNRMGLKNISIKIDAHNNLSLIITRQEKTYTMAIGLNGQYKISENGPNNLPVAIKGDFKENNRIIILYSEISGTNHLKLETAFKGRSLNIKVDDPSGHFTGVIEGYSAPIE